VLNLLKSWNTFAPPARRGRREERHLTAATVTLSCPDIGMFDGVLIDLSAHGARLSASAPVWVDAPILLEIETMPLLSGRIIWVDGHELGMCFDQRLHTAVLDHLVARSGVRRV